MSEEKHPRQRRTPQQRAEEMDERIRKLNQDLQKIEEKRAAAEQEFDKQAAGIREKIKACEQRKQEILAPKQSRKPRKTKKQKIKELVDQASKAGLKPEEIAQRLGLESEEN